MAYTTAEKIEYFKSEKIPNINVQLSALLANYDNDDAKAKKESWQYRKALESLEWSNKRVSELEKELEFVELIGNKPSTSLEIEKDLLLSICAQKIIEFEIEGSKYLNQKFKSGKAEFEKIVLSCSGLTLRCNIHFPKIFRENGRYKIGFEYCDYQASAVTERNIRKLRNS
jgi:hypothetical protein